MGKYHSELLMLFNLAFLMKCKYLHLNKEKLLTLRDSKKNMSSVPLAGLERGSSTEEPTKIPGDLLYKYDILANFFRNASVKNKISI